MERHFDRELESLKTMLMKMASMAEDNFHNAIRSLVERNVELAQQVIRTDGRVDALELEIDNAIVDMLALQKPVASDLRLIIAAQKINNDLERISDHAVNIAQSAQTLTASAALPSLLQIPQMAEMTRSMLRDALDAFLHLEPDKARAVCKQDDQVDDINRSNAREVIGFIGAKTLPVEEGVDLIRVSRNLERVADLATNIAEEVVFLTQARVMKHHAEEKK
ncbi:MAG: phosphate signaling complex protein PhoU [Ignavibacteriae bacterium]|nr:phosphate signaling complex protein PhoU [Ignavibacteriota bacterium]